MKGILITKLKTIFFILLNIISVGISNSSAEQLNFDKISGHDVEASLSVRQMLQDNKDFSWLAIFSGMYKYEGNENLIKHWFIENIEFDNDKLYTRGFDQTYKYNASHLNSQGNKFRNILYDYDKGWYAVNEPSVQYSNLASGKYLFEAYATGNNGDWSENSGNISIYVKPTPWLSFWAISLYIFLAVITYFLLRRIILKRLAINRELLIEMMRLEKDEKFKKEQLQSHTNNSHEAGNPLTLIMEPIKQLLDSEKAGTKTSGLNQITLNNSQRLLSLVNQLLDFKKSLHHGLKLKTTYLNIADTVRSVFDAFDYIANQKSIVANFSTEEGINGWIDQEKLDIILFNILSNAFSFTPENGFVNISLKVEAFNDVLPCKHIKLEISNTGKGNQEQLQEIGIELSLTKTLVEFHKGKFMMQREPGGMATYTVYLPISRDSFIEDEISDFGRDADRKTNELVIDSTLKKEKPLVQENISNLQKLLIIEADQELCELLTGYLSREFEIVTTNNGSDGLRICESEYPDLVISAVSDNMDGLQFCRTVKSTNAINHIPVILITELESAEIKMEADKMGADDFLTKPFEPGLLMARVKNILYNIAKIEKEFKNNIRDSAKELAISKLDEDFLTKVIDLININLDNTDLDIDALCKNLGVSSSHLYRKIKNVTGVSPNEFIRTYRLKKAAKMISETSLNISEIAYKVGFNDALYFSKCFKKQFGASPSKYKMSYVV